METALDVYSYAFQSCKSYNKIDGSVSRNDFCAICRHYQLPFDKIVEAMGVGAQDSITQDSFFHHLKRHQHHLHHQHHQHQHQNSRGHLDYEHYDGPTSPSSRPHSGNKQGVYPSHHNRRSLRYPTSPTGGFDQEKFTPDDPTKRRQEHNRTPENFLLSPETDPRTLRHNRGERHRADLDRIAADYISPRPTVSRPAPSPPPPLPPHHPTLSRKMFPRGDRSEHRSTRGGDSDDDDEVNGEPFYPPPPVTSRRTCRNCKTLHRQVQELQDDLRVSRSERERLEQSIERLRKDYQVAQGNDLLYAQHTQLYRDNEKLRQEIKRLRRETNDPDADRTYYDRQFEDLKKQKEDLEDETLRDRVSLKAYKKECSALKAQYQSLKLKNEELQRANWRVVDENQKLMVRLMEEDKASIYSRQRGDGNSEEHSARSSYASGEFQRLTPMRQTYGHLPGKNEVTRDPSSRPRKGRVEMTRTSSAGQALDSDTPVRDQDTSRHDEYPYGYPRGKSVKSVPSETSESLGFVMVTTTPDDQSQVFMVLDEDVSRSVLPEGLSKESELAMIYALQNCHSIQELIKCLVSYGISASGDKLHGFQVENDHLKQCVEHLKSKNATLAHSFDSAKSNTELMYYRAQIFEANNTRLVYALKLCEQAVEVFEILVELRHFDSRPHGSNPGYFPSFPEFNSLESSTRSPDREPAPVKHSAVSRARNLLHTLDSNTELQNYLPGSRSHPGSGNYQQTSHWASTLSQNTSNTSGLSSMSGGMEGEITHGELERLRSYTQALVNYHERLVNTLVPIDGLRGLDTVKKCEMIKDCLPAGEHGSHIIDLEDAANAEELGKVREEKAELRSQIYMMEQEKRRMELEVSRMLLHKQKCDKMLQELQFLVKEEKRKRKKERKGRKGDASMPPHDQSNMSELSIEYQAALEREKDLSRKYEELFSFLSHHVKNSQDTSEELMRFVKELRRANSALVDAFEKSKKRQQAEKKRMKQELVSYMNKVQGNSAPTNEEPTNGTIYA